MAKVNQVKAARKEKTCSVCQKPIEVGKPYKYTKPRFRGQINAHPDCEIPVSMTSSSKMVAIWEEQASASKDVENASEPGDVAQALRDLAEVVRGVADEYQQGADNQREYFPDSPTADESEQKAQDLGQWADEIDSAADDADRCTLDDVELTREEGETDEDLESRKADMAVEAAKEHASVIDECPVE